MGATKAGFPLPAIARRRDVSPGRLLARHGDHADPFGEGKTTVSIGLADAFARSERRAVVCLRPSMGPVFGIKGGGAGGGLSQVVPMEDLNLHFTGDIHAVGAATNLLAAMIDAHVFHGNELGIDPETITWQRALDVNDRTLRRVVTGLGPSVGVTQSTGFDITAASETMGILATAGDLLELRVRLGQIRVGRSFDGGHG